MKPLQNISIIGAGAWGTALAQMLSCAGRNVTLYARSMHQADHINTHHQNLLYLPSIPLHENVHATHHLEESVKDAEIILLATPSQFVRETLEKLKSHLPANIPLVNTAKGIEIASGKLISEVVADIAPEHPFCVLSGPSFADETAQNLPTAVTFATKNTEHANLWAESLHGTAFRPYLSDDIIGAEMGGATKNVIAIACGIVAGKKLGKNAHAAVMTRGMAEIKRLGLAKGAKPETFLGLSGIGDLTLTCNSMSSRNFSLGFELGEGKSLEDILRTRTTVSEGVTTAKALAQHAEKLNVDMPICLSVHHILHEGGDVDEVVTGLVTRNLKQEND